MARLDTIENDFQSFLLTGRADIEARVVGTQRVPIATRLAIYGDAYRSRLIETLEGHYPALLALIGAEHFAALGGAYVQAHDFNLRLPSASTAARSARFSQPIPTTRRALGSASLRASSGR